jgi:hypothetical protein
MEDPVHSIAIGARRRLAHCVAACATVAIGWVAAAMPASADQNDHDDRGSRKKAPTLLATPPLYWNNLQRFVCSVTNVGTEPQEVTVTQHTEFRLIGGGGPLPDTVTTITLPPGTIRSFTFSVPRVVPFPTGNWCLFESADTSVLRASAAVLESGRVLSTIVAPADQNGRKHGGAGKRPPTVLATPPFFLEANQFGSCSLVNLGTTAREVTLTYHTEETQPDGTPTPDRVITFTIEPTRDQAMRFPASPPTRSLTPVPAYCKFESTDTSLLRAGGYAATDTSIGNAARAVAAE